MHCAPAESIAMTRRMLAIGAAASLLLGLAPRFALADAIASGQFRDEVIALLWRAHPDWRLEAVPDDQ